MSQVIVTEKKRKRGLWPVMGLILAVALGIISYFIAPAVIDLTKQLLPQFSTRGMSPRDVHLIFTFLTFVVLMAFVAFLVAIFMPKKAINVNEADLKKEREQMQAYKRYERHRQRRINRETQAYLKEKNRRNE
jgi:hypothetical protein